MNHVYLFFYFPGYQDDKPFKLVWGFDVISAPADGKIGKLIYPKTVQVLSEINPRRLVPVID